jgi:hypothetical protein
LTLPWSTGPIEGQINRLKVVKRTMYGRAGFDLLRSRVMAAAWEKTCPEFPPEAVRIKERKTQRLHTE